MFKHLQKEDSSAPVKRELFSKKIHSGVCVCVCVLCACVRVCCVCVGGLGFLLDVG